MVETLENTYSIFFFEQFCAALKEIFPEFEEREFIYRVFDEQWPDLELKQQEQHIMLALHHFLPVDYFQAAEFLIRSPDSYREKD